MRLLIDEMFPATIAEQPRAHGHDAVSVHDPDYRALEGAPDQEVFALAVAQGRTIVTENVPDYRRLEVQALARGAQPPGIVFTTNRQFPRGDPATLGRLVLALMGLLAEKQASATAIFLRAPPSV